MSTRSTIAVLKDNGQVHQVYCHSDGYPDGVGCILKNHYTDIDKVNRLIALGDLSCLEKNVEPSGNPITMETAKYEFCANESIGKMHSFNTPEKDVTVAYGRDRGESDVDANVFDSLDDYAVNRQTEQYSYIFVENRWFVCNDTEEKIFYELTDEIIEAGELPNGHTDTERLF